MNLVAPVADAVALLTNLGVPVADAVALVSNVIAPVPSLTAPVPDVITLVQELVQDMLTSVPSLVAPVSGIITSVEDTLTLDADAVIALTPLWLDVFLFDIAGMEPVADRLGHIHGAGPSAAADPSVLAGRLVASQSPLVQSLALAGISVVPLPGIATGMLGGSATTRVGHESSLAAEAPLAPEGATPPTGGIPMGVPLFVRQAFREFVRSPSLWALAAVALPGVGGLVILSAAGVRIGYRQANAAFALQTAGIARWARSGPLGVVRSGSVVVVRPRALRVVRPRALRARCRLDKVA
jgi:hypothetical protein